MSTGSAVYRMIPMGEMRNLRMDCAAVSVMGLEDMVVVKKISFNPSAARMTEFYIVGT
jgi:hypothetical protein